MGGGYDVVRAGIFFFFKDLGAALGPATYF